MCVNINLTLQWNLHDKDILGLIVCPLYRGCPLFGAIGSKCIAKVWSSSFGSIKPVLYNGGYFYCVLYTECPLRDVPLFCS